MGLVLKFTRNSMCCGVKHLREKARVSPAVQDEAHEGTYAHFHTGFSLRGAALSAPGHCRCARLSSELQGIDNSTKTDGGKALMSE